MQGSDLVSIVIPAFNAAPFIDQAVSSAVQQTHENIEVIIIDDGSLDDTAERCRAWTRRDPRVAMISREHRGICATYNEALAAGRGAFVAILNADDLHRPDKTAAQVAFLAARKDIEAVFSFCDFIDALGQHIGSDGWCNQPTDSRDVPRRMMALNILCTPSAMLRRTTIRRCGPGVTDAPFVHDYEYWMQILAVGNIAVLPHAYISYRLHAQNHSRTPGCAAETARQICRAFARRFDAMAARHPTIAAVRAETFAGLLRSAADNDLAPEVERALRRLATGRADADADAGVET